MPDKMLFVLFFVVLPLMVACFTFSNLHVRELVCSHLTVMKFIVSSLSYYQYTRRKRFKHLLSTTRIPSYLENMVHV